MANNPDRLIRLRVWIVEETERSYVLTTHPNLGYTAAHRMLPKMLLKTIDASPNNPNERTILIPRYLCEQNRIPIPDSQNQPDELPLFPKETSHDDEPDAGRPLGHKP